MASSAGSRREQLRRQQEAAAKQKKFNRMIAFIAGGVALVLIGILIVVLVQNNTKVRAPQITPSFVNATGDALVVNSSPAPSTAPVVTIFIDYQCPNCRHFEENTGAMLEQEANAGTWTLQNMTMLFMEERLRNTASTRAARAAACAPDPATYAAISRGIFDHQEAQEVPGSVGYSEETLRQTVPSAAGLSGQALTDFQACYDGEATLDFVKSVEKAAYNAGASGTPTLMVNGKFVQITQDAFTNPAALKALILANV